MNSGPKILNVPAGEILFVSSNPWDAAGAEAFGYLVCWCNPSEVEIEDWESGTVGLGRILTGAAFLAFTVSSLPGMFGANLGEVEALLPPPGATVATTGATASIGFSPDFVVRRL